MYSYCAVIEVPESYKTRVSIESWLCDQPLIRFEFWTVIVLPSSS